MENRVTIKIPRPLYEQVQQIIEGSGFSSPTDFIVYVLRDLVGERRKPDGQEDFTQDEIRSIRRKLRNLGYLE